MEFSQETSDFQLQQMREPGIFKLPKPLSSAAQWRGPCPSRNYGLPARKEASAKDIETPPILDSGYSSQTASRYGSRVSSPTRGGSILRRSENPSRQSSRTGSPTRVGASLRRIDHVSRQRSRACSPIRGGLRSNNSLASSTVTSPIKTTNRKVSSLQTDGGGEILAEESLKRTSATTSFVMTMPNGKSMPLDDRCAANVLHDVMQSEVEAAKAWLDRLDWESAEHYENTQYQCFVMEEEFRRVYNRGAPTPGFDQKTFQELVIADTIISMIEKAWPDDVPKSVGYPEEKDNCFPDAFINPAHQNLSDSKQLTSTIHQRKSEGGESELEDLPPSSDSSSNNSKPMQVHRRSSKPKREDAVFNIRYKTQPCMHYQKHRKCPAGDNCHFAHGPTELRHARDHPKFKTQPCVHYSKNGFCPFESTCFFLHGAV